MRTRLQIRVEGIVQGVGFRPCVYALATRRSLEGVMHFAQFIAVCRRSKWSKHVTNSPCLARRAMVGSNAARKMSSACSHALC
jgi:hydrogenase maturation factor HypF (carbamoyltransferase family)